MKAYWTRTVPPVIEPIRVAEAKAHARITQSQEDGLIDSYIRAAREAAEESLGRGLLTQTWTLELDAFYQVMWLPMAAPLQSVTSIQYYDTSGAQQTLSTSLYLVDSASRPARITRAPLQVWPPLQPDRLSNRVLITYVVGWTDPGLIPERIKQGIRLSVAAMDADRAGQEAFAQQSREAAEACWSDKVSWIESQDIWRGSIYDYQGRPTV